MQKLLDDARGLLARFQAQERAIDGLLSQASTLKSTINAFKQYRKEVGELNEAIGRRPVQILAHGAAHESVRVQALEQENADLRTSLLANQQAIKIVMAKYKEQFNNLNEANRLDENLHDVPDCSLDIQQRSRQIAEMTEMMIEALMVDETAAKNKDKLFRQLRSENVAIRRLLDASLAEYTQDENKPPNDGEQT